MGRAVTALLSLGFLAACGVYFVFLFDAPDEVDPAPIVIASICFFALCGYAASFAAEYYPLRATSMTRASLWDVFAVATLANLSSYLGIIVGMPTRVALWRRVLGVRVADSVALLAYLTLIGTALPGLIAAVTLARETPLLAALCGALGLALAGPLTWPLIGDRVRAHGGLRWLAFHLPRRVTQRVSSLTEATFGFAPALTLRLAAVYGLWFLASAAQTAWTLDLFHESAPFSLLLGAQSASFLLGRLSALPLGLGVRDASLVALLTSFGVPAEVAISVAAIDRASSLLTRLLLAGVAMALVAAGVASLNRLALEVDEIQPHSRTDPLK
ncbi:MAG: hypothetical protein ACKVVT_13750 [Dehalococcoidia bacterium]